jgi:4'-phosphopantetheinyl transferase
MFVILNPLKLFLKKEINDHLEIGILDLAAFSKTKDIEKRRDLERAGARFVLEKLLGTADFLLKYTAENKPFLENRLEHISISHSHDKLAVSLNRKENTGIDIEKKLDRVAKIRHKFLNEKELQNTGEDTEKLLKYWAAKETLYKLYGKKGLDFRAHMFVENGGTTEFTGSVAKDNFVKKYKLGFEMIDNYVMVYAINEI